MSIAIDAAEVLAQFERERGERYIDHFATPPQTSDSTAIWADFKRREKARAARQKRALEAKRIADALAKAEAERVALIRTRERFEQESRELASRRHRELTRLWALEDEARNRSAACVVRSGRGWACCGEGQPTFGDNYRRWGREVAIPLYCDYERDDWEARAFNAAINEDQTRDIAERFERLVNGR